MTQIIPNVDAVDIITIERQHDGTFNATMSFREGKNPKHDLALTKDHVCRLMEHINEYAEAEFMVERIAQARVDWQEMHTDWMGEKWRVGKNQRADHVYASQQADHAYIPKAAE